MEAQLGDLPFDVDFHPSTELVAAGLISGDFHLYRYTADVDPQRLELTVNLAEPLGSLVMDELMVEGSFDGTAILTGSKDCSIRASDVETGAEIARLVNAHSAPIFRLINLTESTVASGDDDGHIKVWDTRQRTVCNTFDIHTDYVSDLTLASDSMKLLATSGDGTLSVCNLRRNKVHSHSEFSEEELLSVVIMKNGRKVICGSQSGTVLLYTWGCFKDCSDRFTDLSPHSVDAILKLDEDRIITGTENGLINLVGILPNRIIQPIAEHSEYPVERLAFSHDKKFLGSISHDQTLKIWDLEGLLQGPGNNPKSQAAVAKSDSDDSDMDIDPPKSNKGTKTKRKNTGKEALGTSNSFFADL